MANPRGDQYERDEQYDNGRRGRSQREGTQDDEREYFGRRDLFQQDENPFSDEDRGNRSERDRGFGDERYGRVDRSPGLSGNDWGGARDRDYRRGENANQDRGGREMQQGAGGMDEWSRGAGRDMSGERDMFGGRDRQGGGRETYGGPRDRQSGRSWNDDSREQRQTYGGSYGGGGRPSWETQSGSPEGRWSPYNDSRQRTLSQQTYGQGSGSQGGQGYSPSYGNEERSGYGGNRNQGYDQGQSYRSTRGQDESHAQPRSWLRRIAEHIGKGPKGYSRTDERIQEEVHERLAFGYLDASDIEVTVKNGEVVLKGTVHSKADRRIAEDAIEDVVGVKEVDNRLKVKRPESGASTAALSAASAAKTGENENNETGSRGSSGATNKRS
jgi:osmotically-inducible protein OsmY